MKPNAYRRAGSLPWKQFPRVEIAKMLNGYRRNYLVRHRRFPDGSRAYQFDDKAGGQTNPYTIAVSAN
jgi:hypothetical protein